MSDIFQKTKSLFDLPDGVLYLDGNSLGPLPKAAAARVEAVMKAEWGQMLITGWNKAGWMAQPNAVGDRLARLIGAQSGHVVVGDTLSIKVYQALDAALQLRPDRKVILSDSGNFPSDLYIAQGLIQALNLGHELRLVAPEDLHNHITQEVAVTLITQVDYRTGRLHDMCSITEKAHQNGALCIWDLAHSAGAIEVELAKAKADFAVGCTYKYLNGGPGSPGFIYVAPHLIDNIKPTLSGWLGHAAPFAFAQGYEPGNGIDRMRVGTPPVLALASLEAALDVWDMVDMAELRAQSIALSQLFIAEIEKKCPMLTLGSPRDPNKRGSQVAFRFQEGYAAMQALIERGVIGDFRAPETMRFGFTPLYIDQQDVRAATDIIADVMQNRLWDTDAYKIRAAVT